MGKSLLSISSSSLKFHIPLDTSTKLEVTNFGKYSVQEAEMSEALLTLGSGISSQFQLSDLEVMKILAITSRLSPALSLRFPKPL